MNSPQPWMRGLIDAARKGLGALFKEPPLTAVEWADKHFYMSSESSYAEGRWKTAPFQVAILNAMGNDLVAEVNFPKSARMGYTKMLNANVGYKIQHKRRNVLVFCPTDDDAEKVMKLHFEGMIRDVPLLKALAPWFGRKHRDSTLSAKRFENQKMLWCVGGKAARNYREKSPDEVVYDELSKFDSDIEGEGAPTFLGDKRLAGSTFKKSIRGSTPGEEGDCQITKAADESPHLLRFHIQCPHCGTEQHLKWGGPDVEYGFKFLRDGHGQAIKAWYACEAGHGCTFEHHEMVEASHAGRYICERTGIWTRDAMEWFGADDGVIPAPRSVTFHIWAIYAPFFTWLDMAIEWVKVKGDRKSLKTFINTVRGEVWQEDQGERLDHELLAKRREVFTLPRLALFLTGGIDTQDDRYELRVWAWGAGEECWLVYRRILTGDPASTELRKKVGEELHKTFTREDGRLMRVERWCWDSGGHYSDEVCAESRKHGVQWVIPIFGASTYGKPIATWPTKRNKKRVYLVEVGTDNAKELIYSRFKLDPDVERSREGLVQPGVIHLPLHEEMGGEAELKQLTAERKKPVMVKGKRELRWDAGGRRNEALDCFVYALAALRISQERFGLNLDTLTAPPPVSAAANSSPVTRHEPPTAAPIETPATPAPAALPAADGWLQTGNTPWL